jgi:branched-chain amino acid transport system substrate-binding protein
VVAIIIVIASIIGIYYATIPAPTPTPPSPSHIKVGVTISTTGPYSYASLSGYRGIQVCVDEVNERGGIYVKEFGKSIPLKLVTYDDRSDKEQVARLYEKLITEDQVDIAIAPFGSTLTTAAAAITEKYKKVLMGWSAASDTIFEQGYKYVLEGTQVPNSLMPEPHIKHMAHLGVKTIAILYSEEPFPAGQAKYAKSFAEKEGINVVFYEKYSTGTVDFSTTLRKIRDLKPDAFYVSAYLDDQANILRQMKELDIMFKYVFMVYAGQLAQWLQATGADGLFIFGHTLFHENLKWNVTAGMALDEFMSVFKKKFPGVEPDFQTSLAYGSCILLAEMIKKAGSLNPDELMQAARELSGKLKVLTCVRPIEFDSNWKQTGCPFSVVQVQKDPVTNKYKLVIVWPPEVRTGKEVYPIPGWTQRG